MTAIKRWRSETLIIKALGKSAESRNENREGKHAPSLQKCQVELGISKLRISDRTRRDVRDHDICEGDRTGEQLRGLSRGTNEIRWRWRCR
jgi:hypothetical protein